MWMLKASRENFRFAIARTDAKERSVLAAERRFGASSWRAAAAIFVRAASPLRELVPKQWEAAALSAPAR
jgi:hypothetical protein